MNTKTRLTLVAAVAALLMSGPSNGQAAVSDASAPRGIHGAQRRSTDDANDGNRQWSAVCQFNFRKKIDPIKFHGDDETVSNSHMHDFFGNLYTTEDSTPASDLIGGVDVDHNNCEEPTETDAGGHHFEDNAAYWTPTLYRLAEGESPEPVEPNVIHAYYDWGDIEEQDTINPFDSHLVVIAGDATEMEHQAKYIVRWGCINDNGTEALDTYDRIPIDDSCDEEQGLRMKLHFPNCWDGDSPSGLHSTFANWDDPANPNDPDTDHLRYTKEPDPTNPNYEDHPLDPESQIGDNCRSYAEEQDDAGLEWHPIPQLSVGVRWGPENFAIEDGRLVLSGYAIASDEAMMDPGSNYCETEADDCGVTAHADFMNGWRQGAINDLTERCVNFLHPSTIDHWRQNCGVVGGGGAS